VLLSRLQLAVFDSAERFRSATPGTRRHSMKKTKSTPRATPRRCAVSYGSARRKEVARQLRAISCGARARHPLWTVVDVFTCDLLAEAADMIAPNNVI
jgi:hypothetical protein